MAFLPQSCVCSDGLDSPADEGPDVLPGDGSHGHGHGLRGGQPVRVVVAGRKVADVVDVTEEEGHGAELAQTAARRACVGRGPQITTDSLPRARLREPANTDERRRAHARRWKPDALHTREDGNQTPSTRAKMETNTLEIKTDIYPHMHEDGNKDV